MVLMEIAGFAEKGFVESRIELHGHFDDAVFDALGHCPIGERASGIVLGGEPFSGFAPAARLACEGLEMLFRHSAVNVNDRESACNKNIKKFCEPYKSLVVKEKGRYF